jgi:hypothetical protein
MITVTTQRGEKESQASKPENNVIERIECVRVQKLSTKENPVSVIEIE